MSASNHGSGSCSIFSKEPKVFELAPGEHGYVLLFSEIGQATITYSIKEKQ